jgi:hypothetical protein
MADHKVAQLERLFQHLTDRLHSGNEHMSQAWLDFEFARGLFQLIAGDCDLLLEEIGSKAGLQATEQA